jgi:hypothetical protein
LSTRSFFSFLASWKGFLPNSFSYMIGRSTAFFFDFLPQRATCIFKVGSYDIPVVFLFLIPFSLANFYHLVAFLASGSLLLLGNTVMGSGKASSSLDFSKSWICCSSGRTSTAAIYFFLTSTIELRMNCRLPTSWAVMCSLVYASLLPF